MTERIERNGIHQRFLAVELGSRTAIPMLTDGVEVEDDWELEAEASGAEDGDENSAANLGPSLRNYIGVLRTPAYLAPALTHTERYPDILGIRPLSTMDHTIYPFSDFLTPLYVRLYFAPVLSLAVFVLFFTTTGDPVADYALRLLWLLCFFWASDYILITEVQRQLRRAPSSPQSEDNPPVMIEDQPLMQRVKWTLDLFTSPRGVSWLHEPKSAIPPHPSPTTLKSTFILGQLGKLFIVYLVYDIASLHAQWNSGFAPRGAGIASLGWLQQFPAVLGWASLGYAGMALPHCILGLLCVAVELSGPQEWPAFFWGIGFARSIRLFWVGHGIRCLNGPAHTKRLAEILRLTPGSSTSYYFQVFAVFLPASCTTLWKHSSCAVGAGGSLIFFLLKAVAITVEGWVITFGRKAGIKSRWAVTAVGYAWTWGWFAFSLPIMQDPLISAGLMDRGLPDSVVAKVWHLRMEL
ncbi:hypothetical protein C8J57DRAFT_1589945 [Mycena rebaudengoi]|nr:hypothetical protein C8J57DRAFT_1589945 [Mycena rebaudengoi]